MCIKQSKEPKFLLQERHYTTFIKKLKPLLSFIIDTHILQLQKGDTRINYFFCKMQILIRKNHSTPFFYFHSFTMYIFFNVYSGLLQC